MNTLIVSLFIRLILSLLIKDLILLLYLIFSTYLIGTVIIRPLTGVLKGLTVGIIVVLPAILRGQGPRRRVYDSASNL